MSLCEILLINYQVLKFYPKITASHFFNLQLWCLFSLESIAIVNFCKFSGLLLKMEDSQIASTRGQQDLILKTELQGVIN